MIGHLYVQDYKSFGGIHKVPLRKLTVFLGRNNSGKTSLVRLPIFLAALLIEESETNKPAIPLRVRGLDFGWAPQDLVFRQQIHSSFEIGVDFRDRVGQVEHVSIGLQPLETLAGEELVVSELDLRPALARPLVWNRTVGSGSTLPYDDPLLVGFDGVMPIFGDERALIVDDVRRMFRKYVGRVFHLGSLRGAIKVVYEPRSGAGVFDASGDDAAYMLRADRELLQAVSDWYEVALGTPIDVDEFAYGFRISAGSDDRMNLAFSGQGIQQVFAVATLMKAAALRAIDAELVVIEEPELHLHPSAHADVAELAIEAVTASATQVLLETHSENLCLRIRRSVAEGRLNHNDVVFLWCGSDTGSVEPIEVGADGSVTGWPKGVFSEDLEEIRAISSLRDR